MARLTSRIHGSETSECDLCVRALLGCSVGQPELHRVPEQGTEVTQTPFPKHSWITRAQNLVDSAKHGQCWGQSCPYRELPLLCQCSEACVDPTSSPWSHGTCYCSATERSAQAMSAGEGVVSEASLFSFDDTFGDGSCCLEAGATLRVLSPTGEG